nr:MAG TPA: hypothetical protein [Caudoviricetes sp.]
MITQIRQKGKGNMPFDKTDVRQALIKGITIMAVFFSMLSLANMYRIVLEADLYGNINSSAIIFLVSNLWLSLFVAANGMPKILKWLFP